jgi:exonuclease V gamma subunit
MVKIFNLAEIGEIESQRQVDELTKQCVVGEPLLEFESLLVGTGHLKQDFEAKIIHESIESLLVHLYQLLDETEEPVENEEEIRTYLTKTIKNNLNLISLRSDDTLQMLRLLFDAYLKGNHVPEIVTTAFVLCSMKVDNDRQSNSIDLALDYLAAHHRTHGEAFTTALKHAWNPLLDERLKETLDGLEDPALHRDMETVMAFRNDNRLHNLTL